MRTTERKAPFMMFLATSLCLLVVAYAQQDDRIVCPRVMKTDMNTTLKAFDPEKNNFYEVSGLGFSPSRVGPSGKPLLYAVNDGGDRRMGVWDSGTGERLLSLRMPRFMPLAMDKEAMTVGPCGVGDGETCIYVADVGDNTARNAGGQKSGHDRAAYPIWKIREPEDITVYADNDILPDSYVTRLFFNYSHPSSPTPYADTEAAFIDHTGWGEGGAPGDLYLLTKWGWSGDGDEYPANSLVRLFKIPADAWADTNNDETSAYMPEAVGNYANGVDSNALMGYMWTRAEMSFDGTVIALGDYWDQYLYLRCPGMSVADALAVPGTWYCETWPIEYWDSQFETIAWAPDGSTLEVSECGRCDPDPPMVRTTMSYEFDPNYGGAVCASPTEVEYLWPPTTAPSSSPTIAPSKGVDVQDPSQKQPTMAPSKSVDGQDPPQQQPTKAPSNVAPTNIDLQDLTKQPTEEQTPQSVSTQNGSGDTVTSGSVLLFRRAIHITVLVLTLWLG